jgi:hypothetical protein
MRIAASLLVAVLVLCGCWGEPPPRPSTTTGPRPLPSPRPTAPPTTRPPGDEVVGWCLASPVNQQPGIVRGEFIRCGLRPRPGFLYRGRVVGVTPMASDLPPFSTACPQRTDEVVLAQLPSGKQTLLCLDTKPGAGNTMG